MHLYGLVRVLGRDVAGISCRLLVFNFADERIGFGIGSEQKVFFFLRF